MDAHTRKLAGWAIAAIGAIVVIVSVFAGPIGVGDSDFGPLQIAGIIVGLVIAAAGVVVARRSPATSESATADPDAQAQVQA